MKRFTPNGTSPLKWFSVLAVVLVGAGIFWSSERQSTVVEPGRTEPDVSRDVVSENKHHLQGAGPDSDTEWTDAGSSFSDNHERPRDFRMSKKDLMPGYVQRLQEQRTSSPLVISRHRDIHGVLPLHENWPDSETVEIAWSAPDGDGRVRRVQLVEPADLPYIIRVEERLFLDPRDLARFSESPGQVTPRHVEMLVEELADAIIVRLADGVTEEALQRAVVRIGAEPARVLSHQLQAYRISLDDVTPDAVPEAVLALAELGAEEGILRTVEPDPIVRTMDLVPNDPKYVDGTLWGMNNIGGPAGWEIQNTADNVIVGVIDTGVNYQHPDLQANMWVNPNPGSYPGITGDTHGINAIEMSGDPMDDHGHGTHVAGTIAGVGNNSIGVTGVAWQSQIMGLKFLSAQGGAIGDAITSLDYAITMGAHLTNNSWGGGPPNQTLFDIIELARDNNQMFVAAAGNSANNNDTDPIYPATYGVDNVVAVSAITSTEALASFSTYGPSTVLLGAPGLAVYSTYFEEPWYKTFSGTSMAAPHVAGAVALILQEHNFEGYEVIKARLAETARQIPGLQGRVITEGTLDLPAALSVEEDGNLNVRITVRGESNDSVVFEGDQALLTVTITDLLPVNNAAITATASPAGPDGAAITFSPVVDAPGTYSADYTLPTFAEGAPKEMEVDLTITAPGKTTFTDTLTVSIQTRPANRFLANAEALDPTNPGSVTVNNSFAERETGERERIDFIRFDRSVWYSWTPGSVASVEVNTIGSLTNSQQEMDTVLAVYTSPVPNPQMSDLIEVASNADIDWPNNSFSRVTFEVLEPGTTYYIQAGDTFRAGNLTLNVIPVFEAPIVTQQPPSAITVFEGLPLRIDAFLAGADSLQWMKDGQPLSEGGRFSGTQTQNLVIDSAIESDAATYTLSGTNGSGTTLTQGAVVSVEAPAGLSSWTLAEPAPTGNDLGSVARGSGQTVAVGGRGTLLVRDDLSGEWNRVSTGTDARLNDVAYDGTEGYIAVGDEGTILVSGDGSSWTTADSGSESSLRAVAYSGGRYIAVGGDYLEGVVLESIDGDIWTDRTPAGLDSILYDVVWDGSRFVAVGGHWQREEGIVMDSGDGVIWNTHSLSEVPTLHGLDQEAGTLVAVGGDWVEPVILRNTGGSTWTRPASPSEETLYAAAYANGLWLAAGERGTLLTSPDGTAWTRRETGTDFALHGATWDGTDFFIVGDGGVVLDSSDAEVWTFESRGNRLSLEDVDADAGGYIAVGEAGHVRFSTDGQNWLDRELPVDGRLLGVATDGSTFVKTGADGTLHSSGDLGVSWTLRWEKSFTAIESVTYAGGEFVAVGENGTVVTSGNGTSWTERITPTTERLRDAATDGTVWRVVGDNGVMLGGSSPASLAWISSGIDTTLRGIAHTGQRWVAVGNNGSLYSSEDGTQWTSISSPTTKTLNAVFSSGSTLFAVGNQGTLLTSTDGLVWQARNTRVGANLLGGTFNDGLLVAVGGVGTVLTTVALDVVDVPAISPDAVGNESSVLVTLTTTTPGADIHFTLDGSEPTTSSSRYTEPITLNNPTTVKARAFKTGMEASPLAERTYFLQGAPFILEPAEDLPMALGGSGELAPEVSGDEPLTFQWEKADDLSGPWAQVVGADSRILSFTNAVTDDAGFYRLQVDNAVDGAVSDPVQVWVWETPSILIHPADNTAASGSPVSFTVVAEGGGSLLYQWFKDGEAIPGATGDTYALTSASLEAAGSYQVEVASPVGNVLSNSATLTVGIPPRILTQPASLTRAEGANATFTVSLSGSEPLSIDWQFQPEGGAEFSSQGVGTPTLDLPTLTPAEAGSYRVVVSNTYGSRTSDVAELGVLQAPVITAQPADTSIILGQSGGFNVSVNGTDPLSYQWLRNGDVIPGATSSTLNFASVTSDDGAAYSVLVSNEVGALQSASATLTVLFPAVITAQPTDQDVEAGQSGTFTVSATGSDLTYQWQEQLEDVWEDLAGAESSSLTIADTLKEEDNGRVFRVVVDNAYGDAAVSGSATLNVLEAPAIDTQPVAQSIVLGGSVTFTVAASGDEPLSYQWRRNGSNIGGATSAGYTIAAVDQDRDGDIYSVQVSNPVGQVTSSGAELSILYPPDILSPPQSQTAAVGDSVTFSVIAAGEPTLQYQWRQDGVDLPGETGASLILADVQNEAAGAYSVVVTNDYGTETSAAATLTILESLDFAHAIRITFDGYSGTETLTNFPVPVKLNDGVIGFDYADFLSTSGNDLRFWTSDLQPLVYEIEQWDTTGDSYVWVRVPELSQGTFIYASWGDSQADPVPESPANTWSQDFLAAWHLNRDPATTPDSANFVSDNSGALTTFGTSSAPSLVPGVIGQGYENRNDLTHRVAITNSSHLAGRDQATYSFWYRRDIAGEAGAEMFAHDRSGINRRIGYYWSGDSFDDGIAFYPRIASGTVNSPDLFSGTLQVGDWYHVAITQDKSSSSQADFRMYLNGVEVDTALNRSLSSSDRWILEPNYLIGSSFSNSSPDATLDEMRMASTVRSPAWIQAEFAAMADPHTFGSYEPATVIPNTPIISLLTPAADVVRIPDGVGLLLEATVSEPVEESGALAYEWTSLSGPSTVVFEEPAALATGAEFGAVGEYLLSLQVTNTNDPTLSAEKIVTVTVTDEEIGGGGSSGVWTGYSLGIDDEGSFTNDGQTITLQAQSTNGSLNGDTDIAYFVALPVFGDGTLTARVKQFGPSPGISGTWASKVGLMILEDPAEENTAKFAATLRQQRETNINGYHTYRRLSPSESGSLDQETTIQASQDLVFRLIRQGNGMSAEVKDSSGNFVNIGSQSFVSFPDEAYVGVFLTSWASGYTAEFDQIVYDFAGEPAENIGPWVSSGQEALAVRGEAVPLSGEFLDDGLPDPPAGVTLSWSQLSGPETVTLSDPAIAQPDFTPVTNGEYTFRLAANDGEVTTYNDVMINVQGFNPPQITSSPERNAVVGEGYSYTMTFTGGDEETLTVSAPGLPEWLSLGTGSHAREWVLSGTPGTFDEGVASIQIVVSDADSQDTQNYDLRVWPAGTVPGLPQLALDPEGTITPTTAEVNADLLAGDDPVSVDLWYGLTDGGGDVNAWDVTVSLGDTPLGPVTHTLTSLADETEYFYRFAASNAVGDNQTATASFTTPKDLSGIVPVITLSRPTVESVQIPDGVGLVLETSVTETGGASGQLSLLWENVSGPGTVTWDNTDQENTAAWFGAQGDYVLRLTADNGVNNDMVDLSVSVVDPALATGSGPVTATEELLLLVDFSSVNTIGGYAPPSNGSAPQNPNTDGNGHYWNTIHRDVVGNGNTALNLQTSDGTGSSINLFMSDGIGNPASSDHWTGADPARSTMPAWVPAGVSDANNPLDDRANIGNDKGVFTLSGLPELGAGQSYRVEVVSATIFTGAGDDEPGLFNLEAANSTGGNQSGNDAGSIVPKNGLTGDPLVWMENTNSNADRFGFAFNSRTDVDMGVDVPNQGWMVWEGVLADNGAISIHASAFGTDPRAPVNALAVYIVTEGNQNIGPLVDAGEAQTVEAESLVTLAGTMSDDGLPEVPGAVTTEWVQRSGPAVTLNDTAALAPAFTPTEAGTVHLRLTAFDGEIKTAADVVIEVNPVTSTPYEDWLVENGLDESTDPEAEDPGTGLTYYELYVMGANDDSGDWRGVLEIGSLQVDASEGVTLNFEAQADRRYVLQTSPSLSTPDWQDVPGAVVEQEGAQQFTLPTAGQHNFYRIEVEISQD
jgi:subtilisin family serine protease